MKYKKQRFPKILKNCTSRLQSKVQMSFKAAFDIAINFSYFKIKQFYKAGSLFYKASVYSISHQDQQKQKKYAYPTNILYQQSKYSQTLKRHKLIVLNSFTEHRIDEDQVHFVSRLFPVNYVNRNFAQNTTCNWKVWLDVEEIQNIDFFVEIELIYNPFSKSYSEWSRQNGVTSFSQAENQIISTFKAKINKPYNIFSYLPITFDQFDSIQLQSTYHAVISEFKFSNEEQQQNQHNTENQGNNFFLFAKKSRKIIFQHFKEYLDNVTEGFLSTKIRKFYAYYRDFLASSLQNILKRTKKYVKQLHNYDESFKQFALESQSNKILRESQKFSKLYDQMFRKSSSSERFEELKQLMSEIILQDLSLITQQIYLQWTTFNNLNFQCSYFIVDKQQSSYVSLLQQRYKNNIFSHKIRYTKKLDFTYSRYDDSGKMNIQQASKQNEKRQSQCDVWKGQFDLQNANFSEKQHKNIKFFEQRYETDEDQLTRSRTQDFICFSEDQVVQRSLKQIVRNDPLHIIFLVHGFGAGRADMVLLKRFIEQTYNAQVLISVENVGRTQESIQNSGQRLAQEVTKYLRQITQHFKLSFIGHSMGGLIIRSALPKLSKFSHNFHSYISLCSPHLGYLYQPPNLIKVGLWMLNQVQKCPSISQIEMKDSKDLRKCYMYQLSQNESLKWFKNVAFIASCQDSYVPYESARVQKSQNRFEEINDNDRILVIKQMIDSMLKNLKQATQISRINVVFSFQDKITLQSLIGRLGHVKFLSDEQFIKQFVLCFKRFFQ